ncbi:MAG: hypothetical protein E7046_00665 [Lentisphaerae bacterium]|nr:hypothetical protein [Lentisphaerota bacterium]
MDESSLRGRNLVRIVLMAAFLPIFAVMNLCVGRMMPDDVTIPVTVDWSAPSHEVSKDLYGLFLEDISLSVDGCFYPELVWNRGFDFPATNAPGLFAVSGTIQGWSENHAAGSAGRVGVRYEKPKFEKTPAYLRIEAFNAGAGVINTGPMQKMGVAAREPYALSLWARGDTAFDAVLCDENGDRISSVTHFIPQTGDWLKFTATLTPERTVERANLKIRTAAAGTLDLDFVSLMPVRRFRGRANGVREDIGELMAALRPGTFRFPGGCMLEGNSFDSWYDWKRTVGPIEEREPIWNIWGYYQTLGIGYFEYFQFCEDIGAKPVPVFLAGLTCQLRPPASCAAMESIGYFLTNILDGIEFARGGVDTKWGRLRAEMGHPAPFALEYVAIGNENRYDEFFDRYDAIARALRRCHPDIKLVTCVDPAGYFKKSLLDYSWGRISRATADFGDEHIYGSPSWWLNNTRMYDAYPRKGVGVYVGEWATRNASDEYLNSHYSAVCEAAFRMGFERNADLVKMSAYAPLVRRVGFPGNRYSLIRLGGLFSYGTPAYWCEKMFADNRPDSTVAVAYPLVRDVQAAGIDRAGCRDCGNPDSAALEVVSFHAVGGVSERDFILKIANAAWYPRDLEIDLGAEFEGQNVYRSVLTAAPDARNTPLDPQAVVPRNDQVSFPGGSRFLITIEGCSVMVLRLRMPHPFLARLQK